MPGHRRRRDPSIAGGASLALAGRVARRRVLCVQHPGIRHCRTDRRTRCRWRVGSPRAQAPIRHRTRGARGRVRRHLRVRLESLPGQESPVCEHTHPGDHPEGALDAVAVLSLALAPALLVGVVNWVPHWWRSGDRIGVIVGALIGAATATMIYADQIAIRIGGDPGTAPDLFVGNVFASHGSLDVESVRRQPAVAVRAADLGPVERSCAGHDVRCLCLPRRRHRGGASSAPARHRHPGRPDPRLGGGYGGCLHRRLRDRDDRRGAHRHPLRSLHVAACTAAGHPAPGRVRSTAGRSPGRANGKAYAGVDRPPRGRRPDGGRAGRRRRDCEPDAPPQCRRVRRCPVADG